MKITLNEEQSILAQSVARFVDDRRDAVSWRPADRGLDPEIWREVAALGWLGAGVGEAAGGFGGGRAMSVVMEGAGGGIRYAEPLSQVFVALAILESADAENPYLSEILSGEAFACGLIADMGTGIEVIGSGDDCRISGAFKAVPYFEQVDHLVLALPDLICVLDAQAAGIDTQTYPALDGATRADLSLDNVPVKSVTVLAKGESASVALNRGRVFHAAAVTAEASGLAAKLFEDTLAYVKQRTQFGQPIGEFQAVQHRLADMFVALEEIRSLSLATARAAEDCVPADRRLSQAVVGVIDRALHIAREAIQLHGGVGMTEDLPMGAGLRRLKVLQLMPAGAQTHRRTLTSRAT